MQSTWRRLAAVLMLVLACTSCQNSSAVCADPGMRGIELSVRAPDGTDISLTTCAVIVRLAGSPPSPVDSVQGLIGMGLPITWADLPGQYILRVRHEGFVPQERTVTVPEQRCGSAVTQHVTLILVPV